MSRFSEKLSQYIEKSGITIVNLSLQSGFEATHITKFKNGTRKPVNQDKFKKMLDALRLSPSESKELYELWRIEQIGEGQYKRHMAVKNLLLSLNQQVDIKQSLAQKDTVYKEQNCFYTGKRNVSFAVNRLVVANAKSGTIKIMAQPDNDTLNELLFLLCNMETSIPIIHILSMHVNDPNDEGRLQNLAYLQTLLPCLLSNPKYEALYYYDRLVCSDNHYLLTPNVVLTQDTVALISKNWEHCVIHKDPVMYDYYTMLFEKQYKVGRPMGRSMPSLMEELEFLLKNVSTSQHKIELMNWNLSDQPCLLPFVQPSDKDYIIKDATQFSRIAELFFQSYQPIIRNEQAMQFFQLSGLQEFLDNGIIWELGEGNMNPIPLEARLHIIRSMLSAVRNGKHAFHLIDKDEIAVFRDVVITFYSNDFVVIHIRNDRDHFYALSETGMANEFREFMEYLPQSSMVYSKEKSMELVEKILDEYEQKAGRSQDQPV